MCRDVTAVYLLLCINLANFILREEEGQRLFENRLRKGIFGPREKGS
jgi:hypothetical protein